MTRWLPPEIKVFSTCPESRDTPPRAYRRQIADVARWSEAVGCEGILVYSENGIVDAWLASQVIVESTDRLAPLVAVQPVYMHPYTVAKMVSTLAHLYERRTYLNMIAGGFVNDLTALGDGIDHDRRYDRLTEYTQIIHSLTTSTVPVTVSGEFYSTHELRLQPPVPAELAPELMISGSSEAGLAAARALGAIAVKYPHPLHQEQRLERSERSGMRIGIIARDDREQAWRDAYTRFPEDRGGQIAHHLAMQVSDSSWHRQLSQLAEEAARNATPYWLGPFRNYQTYCPYLVGAYDDVAAELAGFIERGFTYFILDIPGSEDELQNAAETFRRASSMAVP